MSQKNIEEVLEGVRAVEAKDPDAGLIVRRVVEKAEDHWNDHPDNDNSATAVIKNLSAEDLQLAAEKIGLGGNVNVQAFIAATFS
jgi:hypothetical protein